MKDKAVLITGGARRIGAALARGFADAGYDVALHYNNSKLEAETLANEIGAKLYQADLTNNGAAAELVIAVKADFPKLNTLINNASTFRRAYLKDTTDKSITEDIAINLEAPLNLMREFAKYAEKGNVINMLDTAIHHTHPAHFAYLIAKKGLAEATKMAAREYIGKIRVNGICLGHILPIEGGDEYEPKAPPVIPTIEQVVEGALSLAETPAYIGQILKIDGGNSIL